MVGAATRMSGNLPARSSPFVGRREQIAEVRRLLSSSRLLTLTGPGGVGKTRLALHVAAEIRRSFPDGTWMVDLAALDDPALVAQSVAVALGIRDQSPRWPVAIVAEHVADKHLLVVLDNCEHLVDACAVLADAMLQAAPEMRILATSRQSLGLPSEQIIVVPTLSVPDPDAVTSVAEVSTYDAVRLFVTRAAGVLPGFALTPRNAATVVALCARLDGLPLAIELSAVRLRALSPEQVLERLDERFRLLTGGSRAASARQQTLYGLVSWSFDLCSPLEQTLWARLSVFSGSFHLEAVEHVCSDDTLKRDAVLDLVAGLVDKSVLLREDHESGARYRLLDTIREFGHERLAERGEELRLRRAHRDHYLQWIGEACAGLFRAEGPLWLERIRLEHPNVRAALDFSLAQPGESRSGLELAAGLWLGWRELGLLSEGRRWLDRLLAVERGSSAARAHALWANGHLALLQGDVEAAKAMLAESSRLSEQLADDSGRAYAELFMGVAALVEGDLASSVDLLEHALERHRASGDVLGTSVALIRLAAAASTTGDGERATRLAAEYVALCTQHGATLFAPFGHTLLSFEYWRRGDVDDAVAEAREAVRMHWENQDRLGVAQGLEVLAWAAAAEGNAERAARLLAAADNVWRTVGAPGSLLTHLVRHRDECVARCRQVLGPALFNAATERGAKLSSDDAVAYALDQRPATPTRKAEEVSSPLTRREREVADLVARGMSNKEIASALVISQRTAEAHVEHILVKLGFNSRTQVATWVTARKRDDGSPRRGPQT
jgi:predicted ATPase/DNA-binding CsgD family transcriptional regulator